MREKDKINPLLEESLATLSNKGPDQDQFPKRLDRYGKARAKSLDILGYIVDIECDTPQHKKLIVAMRECGNYLLFRDYYTIGEIRLKAASFCKKHLLCPLCAIRRGAAHLKKYHDRYLYLVEQNTRLKPYLVTFTIKDGPDLKERFTTLQKGIKAYQHRRHVKRSICEAKKALAGVSSYEIKRGSGSGLWHPHVHAIWLCEEPPNENQIMHEWSEIIGDGSFMCNVKPIDTSDLIGGFCEVFKYATKFSDQSNEDTWHTYQTLSGRRLISSFGLFRGIEEPDELTDELLSDELPYIDRLYNYSFGKYHLAQEQVA